LIGALRNGQEHEGFAPALTVQPEGSGHAAGDAGGSPPLRGFDLRRADGAAEDGHEDRTQAVGGCGAPDPDRSESTEEKTQTEHVARQSRCNDKDQACPAHRAGALSREQDSAGQEKREVKDTQHRGNRKMFRRMLQAELLGRGEQAGGADGKDGLPAGRVAACGKDKSTTDGHHRETETPRRNGLAGNQAGQHEEGRCGIGQERREFRPEAMHGGEDEDIGGRSGQGGYDKEPAMADKNAVPAVGCRVVRTSAAPAQPKENRGGGHRAVEPGGESRCAPLAQGRGKEMLRGGIAKQRAAEQKPGVGEGAVQRRVHTGTIRRRGPGIERRSLAAAFGRMAGDYFVRADDGGCPKWAR